MRVAVCARTPSARSSSLSTKGFKIRHCAGVASSEVLVVRGGVLGSNDLVFIGSAPNIAAKLSAMRSTTYRSWITKGVDDRLNEESKYATKNGVKTNMWTAGPETMAGEV